MKKVFLDKEKIYLNEVITIATGLPEYFNENGIRQLKEDINKQDTYIIYEFDKIVGFAIIHNKNDHVSELSWLAIDKEKQGQKYGTLLIESIYQKLKQSKKLVLEVKTLSEIIEYEPYRKTREFYKKRGFFLLETIDPYVNWGPGNPCAIYIKIL